MNKTFCGIVFFFSLAALVCHGQGAKQDTVFLSSSVKNTKALYEQWIGGQSRLYNGLATKGYSNDLDAEPYFAPDWEDGSVYYDDELYVNVPLMYDQITDKVVTSHFYSHSEIELISKKVDWFSILGHTFIHLGRDQSREAIPDGFYDLLHDGNVKLFAQRQKRIEEEIVMNKLTYQISATNKYFIYKDGAFIPVKKKSSVLAALSDKKKELQDYSKRNKLDFRKATETSILQMVRHYDQAAK
ncbi:MAG TPA: hypothetical protein VFE57_10830 [Cyclobacteriaceae bacterium]|jgi:hypothetical protein|nr:hypothetical protein [Cyclobacteriaceae bacterium]